MKVKQRSASCRPRLVCRHSNLILWALDDGSRCLLLAGHDLTGEGDRQRHQKGGWLPTALPSHWAAPKTSTPHSLTHRRGYPEGAKG